MRRLAFACAVLVFLFSRSAAAWNLADHREMALLSLQGVFQSWGLTQPVEVHPLSSLLDKLRPLREQLGDAWHFSYYLGINPKIDIGTFESFEFPQGSPRGAKNLTPLDILFLYSTDPDDGRDRDLFVRDATGAPRAMFPDQKWFGALQGPNSQAFRHMEKPPFSLKHPLATLGLPLRAVGEASRRVEIYYQLSRLAFSLHEDYWGWRFLAGGLHYLQDLHQPFHAGMITPVLLKKGLRVLLTWGWKEKGFIGSFVHVVSNAHRFFEAYVDHPDGHDRGLKAEALKVLQGTDESPLPGSVEDLAHSVRDASNLLYGPLLKDVIAMTGDSLMGRRDFLSTGAEGPGNSNPNDFIKDGTQFEEANRRLFAIVKDRFASAGRVTRAYVHAAIRSMQRPTKPEDILSRLDGLMLPPLGSSEEGGKSE